MSGPHPSTHTCSSCLATIHGFQHQAIAAGWIRTGTPVKRLRCPDCRKRIGGRGHKRNDAVDAVEFERREQHRKWDRARRKRERDGLIEDRGEMAGMGRSEEWVLEMLERVRGEAAP